MHSPVGDTVTRTTCELDDLVDGTHRAAAGRTEETDLLRRAEDRRSRSDRRLNPERSRFPEQAMISWSPVQFNPFGGRVGNLPGRTRVHANNTTTGGDAGVRELSYLVFKMRHDLYGGSRLSVGTHPTEH